MNNTISVVIRTMPNREHFLDKCLFILSGQEYKDIEPIIVAQQLTTQDSIEDIQKIINKWKKYFSNIHFIHHVSESDARARSLNLGSDYANGRYLAFLDDDDKLYPHHYKQLIDALKSSSFAWGYSDVMQANYNNFGQLVERIPTFKRENYSFIQHLKGNFIPIHAFVLDRERVSKSEIGSINEQLDKNEDYDFLIRLASKYQPIYIANFSAEYCFHGKNTNTIFSNLSSIELAKRKNEWLFSAKQIHTLKEKQIGWWVNEIIDDNIQPIIQPVSNNEPNNSSFFVNSTVNNYNGNDAKTKLNQIYRSYTWKVIRFGKKINWFIRKRPKKKDIIPDDGLAATEKFNSIVFSTSWLLFSPLFLIERIIRKL